jgi:glutamate-5-semialdehyde dehydrogenase
MVYKEMNKELPTLLNEIGLKAKSASAILNTATNDQKNKFFDFAISSIHKDADTILAANQVDIKAAEDNKKDEAFIDRLALDKGRLEGICDTLAEIKSFKDPVGKVLASWDRPNGLNISRVATPLGVIGLIFESRPNVAADAGGLCLKSGNAVILRSGKDGLRSAMAIVSSLQNALKKAGLPEECIQIVPSENREAATMMLEGLNGSIDVIVPRGGKSLVAEVERSAKVPVFGHLEGICHIYVDEYAAEKKALSVCMNAKMRRTGICGAVETILINEKILSSFVPKLAASLSNEKCEIRCCEKTIGFDARAVPASEDDWSTEYLAPIVSIKAVAGVDEAIEHIQKFGTGHTESIISENKDVQSKFTKSIDSAIVMINASTQFADGGEFGLGGEIGIATGKFHARGPVGVDQLTSFKYIVSGDGQIRD